MESIKILVLVELKFKEKLTINNILKTQNFKIYNQKVFKIIYN